MCRVTVGNAEKSGFPFVIFLAHCGGTVGSLGYMTGKDDAVAVGFGTVLWWNRPYVAVRLREQGETMLTGDEVYYGVGPVPTSFHLAARKGWLEQAFRRLRRAAHQPWGHSLIRKNTIRTVLPT